MVKNFAIDAVGLGFDSRAGLIGQNVATATIRFFGVVLHSRYVAEMDLAIHYSLRHNTASMMKV